MNSINKKLSFYIPHLYKEKIIMILFTKPNCKKCHDITDNFNLDNLGIQHNVLDENNADALAYLALYELIDVAKNELPILVLDNINYIIGNIKIKIFLKTL